MKIIDSIFKILTLFLLAGILLVIVYFGFKANNGGRYVKFTESGGFKILDQDNGVVYGITKSDNGEVSFFSLDFVNGKAIGLYQ